MKLEIIKRSWQRIRKENLSWIIKINSESIWKFIFGNFYILSIPLTLLFQKLWRWFLFPFFHFWRLGKSALSASFWRIMKSLLTFFIQYKKKQYTSSMSISIFVPIQFWPTWVLYANFLLFCMFTSKFGTSGKNGTFLRHSKASSTNLMLLWISDFFYFFENKFQICSLYWYWKIFGYTEPAESIDFCNTLSSIFILLWNLYYASLCEQRIDTALFLERLNSSNSA